MKEIKALENKYGTVLFRMGLTHLVDVGTRHLTEENVDESIRQIMAEEEANKTKGIVTIMRPEFQCEIIRCAFALSKYSIWKLFSYIKEYVPISD